MESSEATGLNKVWQQIQLTVTNNIDDFWTYAAAAVGAIAVIWFCRLGLRLLKNMVSSAS